MNPAIWVLLAALGLVVLPWDVGITPGPMPHDAGRTPADEPQDAPGWSRSVVWFPCGDVRCQAWLYLPKHTDAPGGKPPIVIAAHGIGAQKDLGLGAYGERFAAAGLASLIFDYRTFGGSEGEPRHWISPERHQQDYASAAAFVAGSLGDRVDAGSLLLWGTSFAGGHVLNLAGGRLRGKVAAVVAQVPFLDGRETLSRNLRLYPATVARMLVAGLHDAIRSLLRYPPAYVPLVGSPSSPMRFMTLDEQEMDAYYAKHPPKRQGGWRNLARASSVLHGSQYRPITAVPDIEAPVLFVAAKRDSLCPFAGIEAAAKAAKQGQLLAFDCNHFEVYGGRPLEYLSAKQAEFFRQAVGLPPRMRHAHASTGTDDGGAATGRPSQADSE